jgi:hypothetical protein
MISAQKQAMVACPDQVHPRSEVATSIAQIHALLPYRFAINVFLSYTNKQKKEYAENATKM